MTAILENLREFWLVHVLLALYTVLLVYHAYSGQKETKGLADYYVGGRGMGGVALGLSFFATYSSTNSFVGFSGQAHAWGAPWLLLVPFVIGFSLFAWSVVAPRLRVFTRSLDSLTVPDFIGFRFDSTAARFFAAVIVLFASLFYMTAVFKGIGNLLETFMGIPYKVSIALVFIVVMLYTAVGGFISVVKTDAVQGVVMSIAAVLLFTGTVSAAGGLGAINFIREAPDTAHLFSWGGGVAVPTLFGVLVAGTIKFAVEPRQLSRFYALDSPEATRTGMLVSTVTFTAVYSLLVPVGLYARRIIPENLEDTDLVVPTLLATEGVFTSLGAAFLLVAMVAAAMSSLDSVLLVLASTAERDLVGVFRPPRSETAALRATRVYVAVFALITAIIALNPPGGIVTLTALSGSLYGACFLPAVVLGLYWRRGNGAAVIASYVCGLIPLIFWRYTPWAEDLHQVFPALVLSATIYVVMSAAGPSVDTQRVTNLFDAIDGSLAAPKRPG
jgi:SSS family transporter